MNDNIKDSPSYYAILTADVRYDKNLMANSKLLYAEITALSEKTGHCWASDNYFSDLYGVNTRTIQRWLKELEDGGYIKRDVIYKKDNKEIEKRFITTINKVLTKKTVPYRQKRQYPTDKNVVESTTSTNTTSTNEVHIVKDEETPPKERIPYKEIIGYLNERVNKNYDFKTEGYRKEIRDKWNNNNARLKDFQHVIDVKAEQWYDREWKWNGRTVKGNNLLEPYKLFGKEFDKFRNEELLNKGKPNKELQGLEKEDYQLQGIDTSEEIDF